MNWNQRYVDGRTPWDIGAPAMPLLGLLEEGRFPVPPGGRILVPGAGRGHCALHLAAIGYEVDAIDVAPLAVDLARAAAKERGLEEMARFHVADLFAVPQRELSDFAAAFDGIYELTCYCAIEPERRGDYVQFVASCLRPGGVWAALLFPLWDREGGPPYRIDEEELTDLMTQAGMLFEGRMLPTRPTKQRAGREAFAFYRKPA
ncbi:MAG: SAM-dependent methyltransferase [Planctomycetota bacterium]|nr:MAG: SAM-dependent methyltransferase [Planctomycetota bacterium]